MNTEQSYWVSFCMRVCVRCYSRWKGRVHRRYESPPQPRSNQCMRIPAIYQLCEWFCRLSGLHLHRSSPQSLEGHSTSVARRRYNVHRFAECRVSVRSSSADLRATVVVIRPTILHFLWLCHSSKCLDVVCSHLSFGCWNGRLDIRKILWRIYDRKFIYNEVTTNLWSQIRYN